MILFAVATVVVVYRLAARQWNRRAGLVAAAVIAIMPLHVMLSRWAMKDVPLAFFAVLTLLFCERVVRLGRARVR